MAKLTSLLKQHSVALLALFVALGGTSYAATKLPKNSVGSSQIRSGAVTSSEIRGGAVKSSELGAGAVTSTKIKKGAVLADAIRNRSLTGSDLAYNTVGGAQLANNSVGVSKLAAVPNARLLRPTGSSQTIPVASGPGSTGVVFPQTEYSAGGFTGTTEPSSGASGLVIPVSGVYAVSAGVRWATNPTGNRTLNLSGPQPGGVRASTTTAAVAGDLTRQTLATTERFNAGDVIFLSASQTSGAPLSITGSQNQQHFSATFLSP